MLVVNILIYKSNMKTLATTQRVFTWICLLPPPINSSDWQKRSYVVFVIAYTAATVTGLVSSLLYALNYKTNEIEDTTRAILAFNAVIAMANTIIASFFLRHKLPYLFENLSKIYKQCMNYWITTITSLSR